MCNHRRWSIVSTVFLCAGPLTAWAQQDFSNVRIKTHHVAGTVYMLEGSGGNIGVSAGSDGLLIIDDQFAPLAQKIRAALDKLSEGKLEFVLNTHWHGDHTGGNEAFGKEATIIAHTNVRTRLATKQTLFNREIGPSPKEALPVITFDDSLSLHFNGEEIKALHFPRGHTDGDSVIFFTKSNVVHMGDLFFAGMFPFVDLDHGGDVEGLARNVKSIIELIPPDAKIIPGHGPLSVLKDLQEYHQALVTTIEIVRQRRSAGKTLAQTKEAGLPEKWEAWGTGFIDTDRWIESVYDSLGRGR